MKIARKNLHIWINVFQNFFFQQKKVYNNKKIFRDTVISKIIIHILIINLPVLLVPPEVVEVATKSSEPSEFCGGVGVGSGGGPLTGGKVGGGGGCCISGPAGW